MGKPQTLFQACLSFFGVGVGTSGADFFPWEAIGTGLKLWAIFYEFSLALASVAGGYIAGLTGTFDSSFLAGAISGCLPGLFLLPFRK